ncbi:hypothetical protein NL452_27110, partial [Klebsiella pneumoniae]|nr:hypothetical protein [Klebsiella pneumoniae]
MANPALVAPATLLPPAAATLLRSRPGQVLAVVVASLALAVSSHVSVPMVPVPMTLQTLVVTLV